MTFEKLNDLNSFLKEECLKKEAIKSKLEKDLARDKKVVEDCKIEIEKYEKKKAVLVEASDEARKEAIEIFESVATNALQTILGDNLSVVVETSEIGGTKTVDFLIKSVYPNGTEVIVDPTSEDGGGAADIVALASLIVMNNLLSDSNDAPIILDEPTKFVSSGNAINVATFLKGISEDFGKQFIMVTHDKVSKDIADKAYYVELDENGTSIVTNVTKSI